MTAVAMGTASVTTPSCVCAPDATGRPTTTANGQLEMYCEPVAMNFDSASAPGAAGPLLVPACEGFDCGTHGKCVPMNGNPTCQCDTGYGATASQQYDQTSQTSKTVVSCLAAAAIPAFLVLPPPGQPSIRGGSAGSSDDAGFCSVSNGAPGRSNGSGSFWLAAGLGAAALLRRRRAS
jgi:MYXO-CTERM domain-containing protein